MKKMRKFKIQIAASIESDLGYWEPNHRLEVNVQAENPTFAAQQLAKALEGLASPVDLYPHGVPPSRSGPLFDFLDFLAKVPDGYVLYNNEDNRGQEPWEGFNHQPPLKLSRRDMTTVVTAYLARLDALEQHARAKAEAELQKEHARHADTQVRVSRMRAAGESEVVIGEYLRWAK